MCCKVGDENTVSSLELGTCLLAIGRNSDSSSRSGCHNTVDNACLLFEKLSLFDLDGLESINERIKIGCHGMDLKRVSESLLEVLPGLDEESIAWMDGVWNSCGRKLCVGKALLDWPNENLGNGHCRKIGFHARGHPVLVGKFEEECCQVLRGWSIGFGAPGGGCCKTGKGLYKRDSYIFF